MPLTPTQAIVLSGAAVLAAGLGLVAAAARGQPQEKVIAMTAMKFDFTPDTITLKKGEPVVLELISVDRTHGFSVPELKLRADVPAESAVKIRLTPGNAGRFVFHCDNFCGEGHEDMQGVIVVTE